MQLTNVQWDKASTQEKVELAFQKLECKSTAQFARQIGVRRETVSRWRSGKKVPKSATILQLRALCVDIYDEFSILDDLYAMFLTASVDSASDLVCAAFRTRNKNMISTLAKCISSKLATLLHQQCPTGLIITQASVFNVYPVAEDLRICVAGTSGLQYDVTITHAPSATEFMLQYTASKSGVVKDKVLLTACDNALAFVAAKIIRNIKTSCR